VVLLREEGYSTESIMISIRKKEYALTKLVKINLPVFRAVYIKINDSTLARSDYLRNIRFPTLILCYSAPVDVENTATETDCVQTTFDVDFCAYPHWFQITERKHLTFECKLIFPG